jgi:hypothetical protein
MSITIVQFPEPFCPIRAELLIRIESKHRIVSMGIAIFSAVDPGPETIEKSFGTRDGPLGQVEVLRVLVAKILEQSKKAPQLGKGGIGLSKSESELESRNIREAP